ncbi:hypothetical protein WDW37_17340 [Bdellovibrionota bacterium FG-1]
MSVRNKSDLLARSALPPVWQTLNRIQETLSLSDSAMADLMRLTSRDFTNLKTRNVEPLIRSTMALAEVINVGFDSLVTNAIDYVALSRQFFGNECYIPEKYVYGASSKRRSVVNLLDYVEQRLGWERRLQILRRFQMTEAMFTDPDAPINLRLSVDIGSWVLKQYRNEQLLVEMGRNAVNTHRNSPMGIELQKARNLRELFEMMCEFVLEKYIEKNFKWSIRFHDATTCSIDGVPDRELIPVIGANYINSRVGCLVRTGFMASIPGYLNFPTIEVKKTKCVSAGDGLCRFELDFLPVIRKMRESHALCV